MPLALVVGVLILACCAPAQAATTTVARSGKFSLHAEEKGGRLCLTLRRERRYQADGCGPIPRSPQRVLSLLPELPPNHYAAAVPRSVAVAEAELSGGQRTRHPTFASPGFSARFVLIPAPPSAIFVRFYAADGTLLGVDAGPIGYIDYANVTTVFGEHFEGVEARTEPRLAPTPDQPDRLTTIACVQVANGSGGSGVCDEQSENALVVRGSCRGPDLLGGIVAAGVAGVRLTLGTGAETVIPAQALPAAYGGRRALGAALPRGEAVREAAALDAAGQVVARAAVGIAPGGQPCAGQDRGGDGAEAALEPVAPPPGAVAVGPLRVADQGETLCAALGELDAGSCPPPPVDSDEPRLLRLGTTVAAVLSRDAAQVTLRLDRGADVTVPTTDGAAYTGRWAGHVRFFAAEVAAGAEVVGATVRDAAGTIIGVSASGVARAPFSRRILAERGGQGVQLVRPAGEPPCLTAFTLAAPRFCTVERGTPIDGPLRPYSGAVVVSCAPRRAIAYGRLPDRLPAPRVVLAGGRAVRARTIALPGENAWVAFLPDATVRGFRAGKSRVALRLPPASRQCGYSAARSF